MTPDTETLTHDKRVRRQSSAHEAALCRCGIRFDGMAARGSPS